MLWNFQIMSRRQVKCVLKYKKGGGGVILAVGNNDCEWSPRFKTDTIRDIEEGLHTYYVKFDDKIVDVEIVEKDRFKYLTTNPEDPNKYNLDSMPICQSYS